MRQLPEEALMERGVAESILALLMMSGYTQVVDRDGVVSVRVDGDVSLTAGYAEQMLELVRATEELRDREASVVTGQELIDRLEPHYGDTYYGYWHTDPMTGERVETQRRSCSCSGWQSHPDIDKINPDGRFYLNTRGTFPSWTEIV